MEHQHRLRLTRRTPLWLAILVGLITLGQYFGWWGTLSQNLVKSQPGLYKVVRDVDGDTIVVNMNGHQETIRFIGVDTPETHKPNTPVQCYGLVAAAYTKSRVDGQSVRLVSDPLSTDRDRYNRLLRYVYLPDGTDLDEQLIQRGDGFAYLGFPFTQQNAFAVDQLAAQHAKLGLWASCHPVVNQYGGYTSNNAT